jgi:hypothetical protein
VTLVDLKQTRAIGRPGGMRADWDMVDRRYRTHTRSDSHTALMLSIMHGFDPKDPDSSRWAEAPCGPLESLQGVAVGLPAVRELGAATGR